jgi:hypothetical protein
VIVTRELAWRGNEAANCRVSFFREERKNFRECSNLSVGDIRDSYHKNNRHNFAYSWYYIIALQSDQKESKSEQALQS